MSQTTSTAKVQTWLKHLKNGNLKSKTVRVLKYIQDHPNTNLYTMRNFFDTADKNKITHPTLTSAISNLMDEGMVRLVGNVEVAGNSYSSYYFVDDENDRYWIKKQRRAECFIRWAKQGLKDFPLLADDSLQVALHNAINKTQQQIKS
jgi:hypothetical protein